MLKLKHKLNGSNLSLLLAQCDLIIHLVLLQMDIVGWCCCFQRLMWIQPMDILMRMSWPSGTCNRQRGMWCIGLRGRWRLMIKIKMGLCHLLSMSLPLGFVILVDIPLFFFFFSLFDDYCILWLNFDQDCEIYEGVFTHVCASMHFSYFLVCSLLLFWFWVPCVHWILVRVLIRFLCV